MRLVEGYRVLGLVRFFDVGRERVACTSHPINLDPRFQIRFSLLRTPPRTASNEQRTANSEQTARIYTRLPSPCCLSLGWQLRGRPANTKSPGAKYTAGIPHPPPFFVFFLPRPLRARDSSFSSSACMHPGNELSLATL